MAEASREVWQQLQRVKQVAQRRDIDALLAALDSPTRSGILSVRGRAARYLGELRAQRAVPALVALLEDERYDVRLAAARALGRIGDPSAVPALIAALDDPDRGVRMNVAPSLGQIGDPSAVPALERALERETGWVFGRAAIVYALMLIDDPNARRIAARELDAVAWHRRRSLRKALRKHHPEAFERFYRDRDAR